MSGSRGELIDVSVLVRPGMLVFEGDPDISRTLEHSIAAGDVANVSSLSIGVHTGTHVDAPFHFIHDGVAIEELSLETMVGPAYVVDATTIEDHFGRRELKSLDMPSDCRRLLFKTRNSRLWSRDAFAPDFLGLTEGGAEFLLERGLDLVGWDYLSIGPFGDAVKTHIALLEAGKIIVEGLNLAAVDAGWYELLCLPLHLHGSDGAPARVVLRR